MNKKRPLLILTGPTAVGKTALSIHLAKALDGEIISADSMQVYQHMDIGTAKITPDEMDSIPHHLIDIITPSDEWNVVRFQTLAKAAMEEIYSRGKLPIITGGTGFYIQALLYDIQFTEAKEDTDYRNHLAHIAAEQGADVLHDMLRAVDPDSALMIHANNVKKIIRALEYHHQTGLRISAHNEEERKKESPYAFSYLVLDRSRDELYQRIDTRVDLMMEQGLLQEVCKLKEMGYHRKLVSMQGLGYKELLAHLDGECSLDEAVSVIKRDTRHFAKRQITWFRRERSVTWLPVDHTTTADRLQKLAVSSFQKQIKEWR